MKAIVIDKFGGAEVLQYRTDWPRPVPRANQVLLAVKAAGINPLDWKIRNGELAFFTGRKFPRILGNDAAGEIVEVGKAVTGFKPGDQVFCFLDAAPQFSCKGFAQSGAYAQYAVTRADTLALIPACLSYEEAAAVPLAALTAYQALRDKGEIKPGHRVLINGASGGVGTMAVQIAVALGAEVTAICSDQNRSLVTGLGAACVLDYKNLDIRALRARYDIIYDVVASLSFSRCKHLLVEEGVFISNIANPRAMAATWLSPLLKRAGMHKANRFAWVKPVAKDLCEIAALIERGGLLPVVDRIYSMEAVREAHEYGETGRVRGKSVLRTG